MNTKLLAGLLVAMPLALTRLAAAGEEPVWDANKVLFPLPEDKPGDEVNKGGNHG